MAPSSEVLGVGWDSPHELALALKRALPGAPQMLRS